MANSASPEQNQNHCSVINNSIPLMQGNLPTLTLSGKIRVTVTFFLFLLSATFNASFLLKLQKWTQKKENGKKLSRMKLLLKHLTLANLLETLIVMPLDGMWNITVQWYAGEFLCKVLSYLKLFSMYAPAFMMVVISLDRSLAITRPLALKSSSKLGQSMVGLAWILSSVFAGPQLPLHHPSSHHADLQCKNHLHPDTGPSSGSPQTATESVQEQYTKSTAEDSKNDSCICHFIHCLLDSLLCPRNLVLV
ncbi:gonadotropin-releasing hormone receptor isoform X2 [Piliocolobus tephrosceles]|uniref:gonadotropin-releasing hormone receptor isoform X2 n=1 Tax=Rhinopithecus bieti TaxID=61621 RepID=UPI00083C5766|nr:PREDICTED: gonadotropin-releasing hormone receptor isoform X2 [Rhinopithecus bieti]XP_023087933.1 gonadotropin-releasing hormone receptor isoform X2 [Piliocolobus tephrosceles]